MVYYLAIGVRAFLQNKPQNQAITSIANNSNGNETTEIEALDFQGLVVFRSRKVGDLKKTKCLQKSKSDLMSTCSLLVSNNNK